MNGVDYREDRRIGFSHVFRVMNPGYLGDVVKCVLATERQLSEQVSHTLRLHVRSVPVKGHRPGNGPLRLYQTFVARMSLVDDQLAEVVLQGWTESNEETRQLVLGHLRSLALLREEADSARLSIATNEWDDHWQDALDQLIAQNPSLSEDDLTLMTYLVGGQMPRPDDAESENADSVAVDVPPLFAGVLGALAHLPLKSPEWVYLSAHFAETVTTLRTNLVQKARLVEAAKEMTGLSAALVEVHSDALTFLEIDASLRLTHPAGSWVSPQSARDLFEKLSASLAEYDQVRQLADTRSQEAIRRVRRIELESQIDEILSAIDRLALLQPREEVLETEALDAAPSILFGEGLAELLADVERLRSENLELQADRDRLAAERDGLSSERGALADTIISLEDDLKENRDNAETWRQLYHLAHMPTDEESSVEERPTVRSVAHAKQLAEERFSGQLEFRLISKSDLDIPFDKPQQVYDGLEWLATIYYRSKTGEGGALDLDFSLKETCGWRYTRLQSETTMGQFEEYYEIVVDGRKGKLEEHIGTGNGYARGTIRIAFLWEADRRKVVVGYIGRHQRTTAT